MSAYDSFHQLFKENNPMGIIVTEDPDGGSYDVAVVVDGGYTERESAEDVAELFRNDIRQLLITHGTTPDRRL